MADSRAQIFSFWFSFAVGYGICFLLGARNWHLFMYGILLTVCLIVVSTDFSLRFGRPRLEVFGPTDSPPI